MTRTHPNMLPNPTHPFCSTRPDDADIGEMTKKTLDNVWNTTRKVKEAEAGDEEKKYEVSPTDHFVDDLRKRAGGYDRRRNN
ncbi:hypothetical protein E3N88_41603 [Mikania micrantha]|uniref:Uncharacterized protein n=1 Tax=Mikania micrantha TaxID=192012 RepID=A0A5N6LK58_9ASTR|nr:hypothetical protein E3N88_41603 [Mikania micrantha]